MSTHAGMLRDAPIPPAAISIERTHCAHEMRWKSEQVGQFRTVQEFYYGNYFVLFLANPLAVNHNVPNTPTHHVYQDDHRVYGHGSIFFLFSFFSSCLLTDYSRAWPTC
ncbi:hypothetical protein F5B17DRAFT_239015 [Nemania serpens]|nr:hypothetical protein F5B17DRAFT_239015 [Nemania serpens]